MKTSFLNIFIILTSLVLMGCSNDASLSAIGNEDDKPAKAFAVEIDESSITDVSILNADSYQISGNCETGLGSVTVTVSSPVQTSVVDCISDGFVATFNLTSLQSSSVTIQAEQGGETDAPSAPPANDQIAATAGITSVGDINYANHLDYSISGTCSEDGEEVSIVVGGVSASPQPFCNNGIWSTLGINTVTILDGSVLITVDHSDSLGNAASQASATVNKEVVVPSVIDAPTAPKDPNWTLKIRPGDIPTVTSSNASSLRLSGYCASGQGDITLRYGAMTFSTPCNDFFGFYQVNVDVSSETNQNPVQHCASQGISPLICSSSVTNELAPPGLTFSSSPLIKIYPGNEASYKLTGKCAPIGAAISIDMGAQTGILTGSCLSQNKFDLTGNVSGVPDGLNINVQANITANSITTVVSDFISKGVSVTLNTPDDIVANNFSSYQLSGSCSDNNQEVILNIGGYLPNPQPVCINNLWSLENINLSSVSEGSVLIRANHIDVFGNAANEAMATVFKDMFVPTVTIESAQNIGLVNETSYDLNGNCSEENREVSVSIGGYLPNPQPVCLGGVWSLTNLDVSTVAFGSIQILADHDDLIGNDAVTATATVVKDTTAPTVSFNMALNITSSNELSYSLSGACSENSREVTIDLGGLTLSSQPVCTGGAWSLTNLDVSTLPQGQVVITANHSDLVNNQALEASVTVGKYDPITLNLTKAECANPYTEISDYTFLGFPAYAYDSVNGIFSVTNSSNWRTLSAQEALPQDFEISFTMNSDTRQMIGFGGTPVPANTWTGIESTMLFYDNAFTYSYANGTYLGNQTDVAMGGFPSEVRIEKIGNTVTYYMNENIFRVDSTIPTTASMYLTFAGAAGFTASYKDLRVKDLSLPDSGYYIAGDFVDPNGANGPYELYDVTSDVVIGLVALSPFEIQYNSGINTDVNIAIRSVSDNTIISGEETITLSDCLLPLEISIAGASCSGPITHVSEYSFLGNPTHNYNSSNDTFSVTGSNNWNTLNAQEALPQDFKISYTIASDTRQMMGFGGTTVPSNTWTGMESIILFYDNTYTYSYANGAYLGNQSDAAMGGFPAEVRVEKIGNTVTYYMNDNVFRVDATIPTTASMYLTFGGSTSAYTASYNGLIVEDISSSAVMDYKVVGSFVDPNGISGLYDIYDATNDVVIGQVSSSPFEITYNSSLSSDADIVVRRSGANHVVSPPSVITLDPCN